MNDEQLKKLESLGILLASFSKHAWTAGEGSTRDKFVDEIYGVTQQIKLILYGTTS